MLVMTICKHMNMVHITKGGRSYTCPTKMIDGTLCFQFLNKWHKVSDYMYKGK